jgi:hypothetical protein
LIVQIHARLQTALNRKLSIIDLFRYPTIAALASMLSQEAPSATEVQLAQARSARQRAALAQQQQSTIKRKSRSHDQ